MRDLISAVIAQMYSIKEYFIFVMKYLSEAIDIYRGVLYPIFGVFPFYVPSIIIDFLVSLTLSSFIARHFFRRLSSQLDELYRQNNACDTILRESGLDEKYERVNKLEIHKKFSVGREIFLAILEDLPQAIGERPHLATASIILGINRLQIGIFIFVFFLTSYWVDLFYRTFFV